MEYTVAGSWNRLGTLGTNTWQGGVIGVDIPGFCHSALGTLLVISLRVKKGRKPMRTVYADGIIAMLQEPIRLDLSLNDLRMMVNSMKAVEFQMSAGDGNGFAPCRHRAISRFYSNQRSGGSDLIAGLTVTALADMLPSLQIKATPPLAKGLTLS